MAKKKSNQVRNLIAGYISETMKTSALIEAAENETVRLRRTLDVLKGCQKSLSKLFLGTKKMTLQEAYDTNLRGLKDAVEKLK